METSTKRILQFTSGLLLILAGVSFATQGTASLVLMALLGATIGVPMGLFYPFPHFEKAVFVFGLIGAASAFVLGIRFRSALWGQFLAVIALMLWTLLGFFGLSTGS